MRNGRAARDLNCSGPGSGGQRLVSPSVEDRRVGPRLHRPNCAIANSLKSSPKSQRLSSDAPVEKRDARSRKSVSMRNDVHACMQGQPPRENACRVNPRHHHELVHPVFTQLAWLGLSEVSTPRLPEPLSRWSSRAISRQAYTYPHPHLPTSSPEWTQSIIMTYRQTF